MPAREKPSKLVKSGELSASAWAKTFSRARASAGAGEGAGADGVGLPAGGLRQAVDRQASGAKPGPGRARTSFLWVEQEYQAGASVATPEAAG